MTDMLPDHDPRDGLDDGLRELLAARALGSPGAGLEARILARVGETRQRRRRAFIPERWSGAWPATSGSTRAVALGSIGLAAVVVSALIGTALLRAPAATEAPGAIGPSGAASPAPTDVPASVPPHVGGTCPLTPITRLAGGSAPEVDVSGLRWRWGGVPWIAGVDEKVVWLDDAGMMPEPGVSVFAIQLDLPILVDGRPLTFAGAAGGAIYAATTDAQWAAQIRLPRPGCWLLTAVWSAGASSVVVAAAPPPATASPAPSTPGSVSSTPLATCPATRRPTAPPPSGWPGPAIVDGPFRWLLPPSATWRIGGDGDKLVLDSQIGWDIGDMRIMAIPLARAAAVGWLRATAVGGDIPPGFGGGTMGFGVTLPARDCWAFVYLAPHATSTIVADLRP